MFFRDDVSYSAVTQYSLINVPSLFAGSLSRQNTLKHSRLHTAGQTAETMLIHVFWPSQDINSSGMLHLCLRQHSVSECPCNSGSDVEKPGSTKAFHSFSPSPDAQNEFWWLEQNGFTGNKN